MVCAQSCISVGGKCSCSIPDAQDEIGHCRDHMQFKPLYVSARHGPTRAQNAGRYPLHHVTLRRISWVPENASLLSEARVASAAPAASFKRDHRKLTHL